jgi:predicted MFS family arabinose efflux permease
MTATTQPQHVQLAAEGVPRGPRLLTGPVLRLLSVEFTSMMSFYLLLAVVPLFAADRGIGEAGAGLSTGVMMFASVAGEIGTPSVAARWGYPPLLIAGLVLLGAPSLLLPAADGLTTVLAISVVRGLGFAVVVVSTGAVAPLVIPAQRRGEGLGVFGFVATVPAVLALPLGVWLVEHAGYLAASAAAALPALVAIVAVRSLPNAVDDAEQPAGMLSAMRRQPLLRTTLMFATTAVAGGVVVAFLPTAVSASVAVPGLFLQAAASTVARWLGGKHIDRHGAARLVVPALAVTAAGMSASAATGSAPILLAGMVVFGAGFGLAQAATLNAMLERVRPAQYGAVSAAWNAAFDLGWGAGAMGIGVVVMYAGYPVAFATTAALILAALTLGSRGGLRPDRDK